MGKVLITGATGMIGHRLTTMLADKGFQMHHLIRGNSQSSNNLSVQSFIWDIEKGQIDKRAFEDVTAIIHLAGAGVADSRWIEKRKEEIIDSRVKSAALIEKFLKNHKHEVKTFVSASAVGYYGDCGSEILKEEHLPGKDFLADVCKKWENASIAIGGLGIREVRCRIGIVLSANGGALPQLTKTLPVGIAAYFAKDNLYYPWVHIDDVCGIFMHALEIEDMRGAYNTTAPKSLLMKDLMSEIIKAKDSKALLVPTPPIALKLAMGEMSEMLLGSQRCSDNKIISAGYQFKFGEIQKALKNIYAE
jgi:uncharacterized protein (TIGR01777 family)